MEIATEGKNLLLEQILSDFPLHRHKLYYNTVPKSPKHSFGYSQLENEFKLENEYKTV